MNTAKWIGGATLCLLVIAGVYLAAYAALLEPGGETISVQVGPGGPFYTVIAPVYRLTGGWVRFVFSPAHEADRLVRPARWSMHDNVMLLFLSPQLVAWPDVSADLVRWAEREAELEAEREAGFKGPTR